VGRGASACGLPGGAAHGIRSLHQNNTMDRELFGH
jgi:hypothetical protein